MTVLEIKKLREQYKQQPANSYYFYGDDILTVEACTRMILNAAGGAECVTKLDGQQLSVSQLAEELALCPMFAAYNYIYIHDCNMDTLKESERKQLLELVEDIPSQTIVVFDVTGFDIYGGKTGKYKKPTAQNKKLIDRIDAHGIVCCAEQKSLSRLTTEITADVRRKGCEIDSSTAKFLAAQCNCEGLLIQNEVSKLCAFADGGLITKNMVLDMVTPQLETTVYMLVRAIIAHKTVDAMHAVDDLLAMRLEMPYLMAVVANSMIDVQRACIAGRQGKQVQDVMKDFGYAYRFAVERAFQDSMQESPAHIDYCIQLLCEAQQRMFSGAVNERVLFEQTILAMLN